MQTSSGTGEMILFQVIMDDDRAELFIHLIKMDLDKKTRNLFS